MKKTGFTLAEVLITLAIIGVVATMTLPALMTNTAEQQAKTGLKKIINTITVAAEKNSADNGYDFNSIASNNTTNTTTELSIYRLLNNNTLMDYSKSGTGTTRLATGGGTLTVGTNNYTAFFKDGTAISFPAATTDISSNGTVSALQADGEPYGFAVLVDINGTKGPNILSNCNATATPNATTATSDVTTGDPSSACNDKNHRVIKDQFSVRLRGASAVPSGPASRWAYEN